MERNDRAQKDKSKGLNERFTKQTNKGTIAHQSKEKEAEESRNGKETEEK
jgi:hypothetical protein